jgi:hypothetical protein
MQLNQGGGRGMAVLRLKRIAFWDITVGLSAPDLIMIKKRSTLVGLS